MGKHGGSGDNTSGTDAGPAFDNLSAEQKGAEFDASHEDPRGYADRNFGSGQSNQEQWEQARREQNDQQRRNRG